MSSTLGWLRTQYARRKDIRTVRQDGAGADLRRDKWDSITGGRGARVLLIAPIRPENSEFRCHELALAPAMPDLCGN
jgi:hypothetical protein